MRAIVYNRISEDRAGLAAGVARQREDCLHRAERRGWTVVAVEEDNDISASSGRRRPGFENVMSAVESGAADVVIAWALDRLQRNRRDELRLYDACRARGVVLSLVNGPEIDFSTAAGRFVAESLGSVARLEVELKSDRQRRAVQQAAAQGRRVGGRQPFGFEQDGVTVREDEAAAIRAGYESVLAGVPLAEIARTWNRQGFTTRQVGHKTGHLGVWERTNIRAVLLNPRNVGKRAHRGEIVADAAWPAIVDEATFQAVSAMLRDANRRTSPKNARQLLSGMALCGVCGATVHGGGGVRQGVRNYRCTAALGHIGRMAAPIEEYVESVILVRLEQPDAATLIVDRGHPDLDALRTEAAALRERMNTAAGEFADGGITATQLRVITERAQARLADIDTALADAGRADILGPLLRSGDVRKAWASMSGARKRQVIDLLATIRIFPAGRGTRTFRPDSVVIEWKTDEEHSVRRRH